MIVGFGFGFLSLRYHTAHGGGTFGKRRDHTRQFLIHASSQSECLASEQDENSRFAHQSIALIWRVYALRLAPLLQQLASAFRKVHQATTFSSTFPGAKKGPALLGAAALMPVLGSAWSDILVNQTFMATFFGWGLAQLLKVPTHYLAKGKWRLMALFDSGGMPSSHSALCMGITTSIAMQYGLSSPLFPMALGFSLIVMYDAAGVRRHAGKQAEVINKIVADLFQGHPHLDHKELKEVLGHTPIQVVSGAFLGVVVAYLYGTYCHPAVVA
ncbi:prolyl aminopeptidase [Cymbomonas tetramitiformis]|uniref:Prolyl aminopeptidase n=1 Tax=Cymbomonas tetramitiformis TaxID=36881 RepID=A0AAE0LAH6_9CHLO|nr:prolyl aminopeptidase [Cymbomonas tetramitiformis]